MKKKIQSLLKHQESLTMNTRKTENWAFDDVREAGNIYKNHPEAFAFFENNKAMWAGCNRQGVGQ